MDVTKDFSARPDIESGRYDRRSEPVIRIRELSIALPENADRSLAITKLDLTIEANEVLCLVGESGAGKSLVGQAIMGLLPGPAVRVSGGRSFLKDRTFFSCQSLSCGG